MRSKERRAAHAAYTREHRARVREKGGIIVYAMITDPDAIRAWHYLQNMHGNNRDAIEAALVEYQEQLEKNP